MTKFAMYIIDLEDGCIAGTNDVEDLKRLPEWPSEQYLIIHSTYGDWHAGDGESQPVRQLEIDDENEEDEDEEGDDE